MRIDSHQHFWKYSPRDYGWINDGMALLKKDYLPPDLAGLLESNHLDGSVAVQARQCLEETRWLLELADSFPFIKGVVGWVDLRSDRVQAQLERFAPHPKLVGVRHVVQDEPDNRFLLDKRFMRGVEKLLDYDLTFDILIFPKQLVAAIEFVASFPQHRLVVDHLAKPFIKAGIMETWRQQMLEIAAFPNVCCKISGLVTEADWLGWRYEDFEPYLDVVFTAFGKHRVMFGSDWPVCTVAASYNQVVSVVDAWLRKNKVSQQEQDAVRGGNAVEFYRL